MSSPHKLWCCLKHKLQAFTWIAAVATAVHWMWHLVPLFFGIGIGQGVCH